MPFHGGLKYTAKTLSSQPSSPLSTLNQQEAAEASRRPAWELNHPMHADDNALPFHETTSKMLPSFLQSMPGI